MRKIICLLLIIIVMAATFAGCISLPDADSVQITTEGPIDISNPPLPDPDELEYFDTLEEAVAHNDDEEINIKQVDERIKLFEDDGEFAVLFFRENITGENDAVCTFKFYVREIDGTHRYSSPVITTGVNWEGHQIFVRRASLDEIGEVRLCISRDTLRWFRPDATKNFFYGFSQTERVRTLQIEGQLVTEVIEVELDGEACYFWYFEDLKTDKIPAFKDIRTYTEGEFVITMDE